MKPTEDLPIARRSSLIWLESVVLNMQEVEKRLQLTRVMTEANNGLAKLDPKKWTSFPSKYDSK